MQFNKQLKHVGTFALGVFALIGAIQFNVYRISKLGDETIQDATVKTLTSAQAPSEVTAAPIDLTQADLASLKKSTATRQTELGQAVPGTKDSTKEIDALLADPTMAQKWDLTTTQTQEAWKKHRALGSKDVKVCVIDTGVDVNHPDLKENIWTNAGETGKDERGLDKATNHVDDDLDGCVDDVHGCNFITGNGDITDHHGHGTHIAGAIGATGAGGTGAMGVSPRVTLIIAKYFDPESPGSNNLLNTVRAIRFCVLKQADIINYSGGGLEPSDQERDAIALASQKGILFVAAAGNEQSNSDLHKYYPADYGLDNIISTTAFDRDLNVLPSSNYGSQSVDIAAPGKNVYSTLPGGIYGHMTGTSQATAIVTGVAALLKARFSDLDAVRMIRHLTETGDLEPVKLAGKTRYQKRLNAYRALAILDSGESVSGVVAHNANNISPEQFSVSRRDVSSSDGQTMNMNPDGLTGFGSDLKAMLRDQQRNQPH